MVKEFKLNFENCIYRLDSNNDKDSIKFILPKMTPNKENVVEDGEFKFYVAEETKLRIYINAIKANTGAGTEIEFAGEDGKDVNIVKAFNSNFTPTGVTANSCIIIECSTIDGGANWFITSSLVSTEP